MAGCRCLSSWSVGNSEGADSLHSGCANVDEDPAGPWCIVDSKTCESVPYGRTTDGRFYDYCTPTRQTAAGCSCSPKVKAAAHAAIYGCAPLLPPVRRLRRSHGHS